MLNRGTAIADSASNLFPDLNILIEKNDSWQKQCFDVKSCNVQNRNYNKFLLRHPHVTHSAVHERSLTLPLTGGETQVRR